MILKNIPSNIPDLMNRLNNLQMELDKTIHENRKLVNGIKTVINDRDLNKYTINKLNNILKSVEEDA